LCCRSQTSQKGIFWIRCPTWILYSIYTLFRYCDYYQYTSTHYLGLSYSKILRQYQPIQLSLKKGKKRSSHKLPMVRRLWLNSFFQYLFNTICKWLLYTLISYFIWTYSSLHSSHDFSLCLCYKSYTQNNS
jgi:hypothetical protein